MPGVGQLAGQLHETLSPLGERALSEVLATIGEEIEGDQFGRSLFGEHRDPGHSGVDSLLEGVEVSHAVDDDHDLAIDDCAGGQLIESRGQLGEVAQKWALVPGVDPVLRLRPRDRAKAIPFRLIEEIPLGPLL